MMGSTIERDVFAECQRQFGSLTAVNNDPMCQLTIADLVTAAEFEVYLYEFDGSNELPRSDYLAIKRFVRRWKPMTELTLTRRGDFYEAYGVDAETLAKALDLVLSIRNESPMAGVPAYAIDRYVAALSEKGYTVLRHG